MGLVYRYDNPDVEKRFIRKKALFRHEYEQERDGERKRVEENELDVNFLLCFIVFVLQVSYMWYMLTVYFKSDLIVGNFSINMIRLISAITLHIMILPEATQGVKLIKFAILNPRHEGRNR